MIDDTLTPDQIALLMLCVRDRYTNPKLMQSKSVALVESGVGIAQTLISQCSKHGAYGKKIAEMLQPDVKTLTDHLNYLKAMEE